MEEKQNQIVDLSQIKNLIGNDEELENTLIQLFIKSTDENIAYLQNNCIDKDDADWKRNSHSIKGSSRNIGAFGLGDLAAKCQDIHNAPAPEKLEHFLKLKAEYDKVKEFLTKRSDS